MRNPDLLVNLASLEKKLKTMNYKLCVVCAATALALAGCSSAKIPPFASSSQWQLDGNVVSSAHRAMAINFGGTDPFPITNLSNGEYALNFIVNDAQFQAYDSNCKTFIASAINKIPLDIDSVELVLADQYVVFLPTMRLRRNSRNINQASLMFCIQLAPLVYL